jgi:hypothetical protein
MSSGPPNKKFRQVTLPFAFSTICSNEECNSTRDNDNINCEQQCIGSLADGIGKDDGVTANKSEVTSTSDCDKPMLMTSGYDDCPSADPKCLASELQNIYQPTDAGELECIPAQTCAGKPRRFQTAWFQRCPWLHVSMYLKAVLCYPCAKGHNLGLLSMTTKNEDAFITKGLKNWKRALEKFSEHQKSSCHRCAVLQFEQIKTGPVIAQLSQQKASERASARAALIAVFGSIRYLARQGLALRGHEESQGNLMTLLELRSQDSLPLRTWLSRTTKFLSPECQNEILDLLSHGVQRVLVKVVQMSKQFGIVVDGTQDCSGHEQESLCIRYVDENLEVNEVFLGLFSPPDTTGLTLSIVTKDLLTRLGLQLRNVTAQSYDGAANMAGKFNGCQTVISHEQPLALLFHCAAHSANLACEHTAASCSLVRDELQNMSELRVLYKRSGKFANIFEGFSNMYESPSTLKPICPTRWLCRVRSVTAVLNQYEAVLRSLEDAASGTGDAAIKAAGLLDRFTKGVTVLGLKIALHIFGPLEELNKSPQSMSVTVSGMLEAAKLVRDQLTQLRSAENFDKIFDETSIMAEQYALDPVALPRQHRPPIRFTGQGEAYRAETPQEHYRAAFFACIDMAVYQLSERLDKNKPGFKSYLLLERMLTTGEVNAELCQAHPELNIDSLSVQLKMFVTSYKTNTLARSTK